MLLRVHLTISQLAVWSAALSSSEDVRRFLGFGSLDDSFLKEACERFSSGTANG